MSRSLGQIDLAKFEAILEAAGAVMSERGVQASVDEIARRAGVSKQTIYNHYGSKADLARAIADRRLHEVRAVLDAPGASRTSITSCARRSDSARARSALEP